MSKFSEFLVRKSITPLDEQPPILISQQTEAATQDGGGELVQGGERLGAENEALRALVLDAAHKIDGLDGLKQAFARIVEPLNSALIKLERERSQSASLARTLTETRASLETQRAELQQRERLCGSLTTANDKFQHDLEQAQHNISALETARIELSNESATKGTAVSELENKLAAENAARQALAEEHRMIADQAQATVKKLGLLETEVVAARQKNALVEDERRSLQSALEQAMNDVSRLSRQMAETSNALANAQSRVTQSETKLVETEAERSRLVAELDEARERHRSESAAQTMRLDALQSRASTAEKLLVEARSNLVARSDEVRAFDRKVVETTIARNAAEKKLAQLETGHQALDHQVKELEQARTALVERNGALTKSLRNRETALARAEEKIVLSTETIARLEAEAQTSRDRENKRVEEITALLERERMERALSEGALEAARKENARLQRENAAIDAKPLPAADLAKRARAAGNGDVHPIVKG